MRDNGEEMHTARDNVSRMVKFVQLEEITLAHDVMDDNHILCH